MTCDGGALDSFVRSVSWVYFGAVGLDTEEGWGMMYTAHKLVLPFVCLLAALLAVMMTLCVWRLTQRRKANGAYSAYQ